VILYRCGTWSLTLKEGHRLRVFENMMLRISGPKQDEVTRKWRQMHNEELRTLFFLPSIIRKIKQRRMRWAGHVVLMGRRGTHTCYWWKGKKEDTTRKTKTKVGG
jgi:hypothetical protein